MDAVNTAEIHVWLLNTQEYAWNCQTLVLT